MIDMTTREIGELLNDAHIGRLCMADHTGRPYAVPFPFCWLDGAVDPWVSREPQARTDNRFRPMAERCSGLRAAPLFSGDGPRASYGQLELPGEARSNHARAVADE